MPEDAIGIFCGAFHVYEQPPKYTSGSLTGDSDIFNYPHSIEPGLPGKIAAPEAKPGDSPSTGLSFDKR